MKYFFIKGSNSAVANADGRGWRVRYLGQRSLIAISAGNDSFSIGPGMSLISPPAKTTGLPAPTSFYIQSDYELTNPANTRFETWEQNFFDNIYSNSFRGITVGPEDSPSPFDCMNFSDSLRSYINQSRTLGWIKDQPTADKYSALVDSAKAQLQRTDSASALATLDTAMQRSIQDSSSSLTSEAFALIYFNAQYLAGLLPAQQQNSFIITSSEGQNGSVAPLGDNTVNGGDSITLTIAPAVGYHISGVFIDNADTSVGSVPSYTFRNVISNHLISAFFAINQYIITATADSNGHIDPHGDNVVNYGDSITFRINPSTGYHVASVYVDSLTPVGAVASYTFRYVTANHTLDAFFAINQYTLSTYSINGVVSKSPNKATYDSNSVVTLSATPNTGYHFVGWSGDVPQGGRSTNPLNVTMLLPRFFGQ